MKDDVSLVEQTQRDILEYISKNNSNAQLPKEQEFVGLLGVSRVVVREALSRLRALGIIETFSAASIVVASDAAVKAADVQLLDVRVALGLGGKGYALMTGDVAAVNAAVEAGSTAAAESGLLVSKVVIPSPAETVFEQIA